MTEQFDPDIGRRLSAYRPNRHTTQPHNQHKDRTETVQETETVTSAYIEIRTWFRQSYGHTYASGRLWINGEIVATIPKTYGDRSNMRHELLATLDRQCVAAGMTLPPDYYGPESWADTFPVYASHKSVPERELFTGVTHNDATFR